MAIERRIVGAFRMTADAWARHANPLSVWRRFTVMPAFMAAAWSRA